MAPALPLRRISGFRGDPMKGQEEHLVFYWIDFFLSFISPVGRWAAGGFSTRHSPCDGVAGRATPSAIWLLAGGVQGSRTACSLMKAGQICYRKRYYNSGLCVTKALPSASCWPTFPAGLAVTGFTWAEKILKVLDVG